IFKGTLEEFQRERSPLLSTLKRLRTASLARARRIVVPSRYLADIAAGWSLDGSRIEVLVNPAPGPSEVVPEPLDPLTFVFVGRLTTQKGLPDALGALRAFPDARVVLLGKGTDLERTQLVAD